MAQVKVRLGIHVGDAEERDDDYFGPVVNSAARVEAAGHGGQVLISDAAHRSAAVDGIDLGEHLLRDVAEPDEAVTRNPDVTELGKAP